MYNSCFIWIFVPCPNSLNCKFGNFRENFIFANSVKRQFCQVTNSRLWHDLTISVNDNEFSPFREAFIFAKLRIRKVSRK